MPELNPLFNRPARRHERDDYRRSDRDRSASLVMETQKEEIGFIETPGGIQRKIDGLKGAWDALALDYPQNGAIQSEYKRFKVWHRELSDSWSSRLFASTIAPEFESWTNRYRAAYATGQRTNPGATITAPPPESLIAPMPESSFFWPIIAIAGAVGLIAVARIFGK
jgi:hypothetical protein